MTRDITVESTEFAGNMKVRHATVDVTSYNNGAGEDLTPADLGMNRFQHVSVNVQDTSADVANFHGDVDKLRVFAGGTEYTDTNSVVLSVTAFGR